MLNGFDKYYWGVVDRCDYFKLKGWEIGVSVGWGVEGESGAIEKVFWTSGTVAESSNEETVVTVYCSSGMGWAGRIERGNCRSNTVVVFIFVARSFWFKIGPSKKGQRQSAHHARWISRKDISHCTPLQSDWFCNSVTELWPRMCL